MTTSYHTISKAAVDLFLKVSAFYEGNTPSAIQSAVVEPKIPPKNTCLRSTSRCSCRGSKSELSTYILKFKFW